MRHARPDSLRRLSPLLDQLREIAALRERSPGVFYRGSKAFLHFHEDGDQLFADVRFGTEFERLDVTTRTGQDDLLRQIRAGV